MDKRQADLELMTIIKQHITTHTRAQYWITDKVAFNMREMIKTWRKNYWGVYDDPLDPVTKQEKLWVPLTRILVDNVRKLIDVDPKDVRFRSKNSKQPQLTELVRGYIREWMSRTYFNHTLDQAAFEMALNGTVVWKTYFQKGTIKRKTVDLLNCFIDINADSLHDTDFCERVPMTKAEVMAMDWENKEQFSTKRKLDKQYDNQAELEGEYGDVYEFWGQVPGKLITLNDADEDLIEAHVVMSGIETGNMLVHLAEKNTHKDKEGNVIKPYEEGWYIKVPGRWYGVSVPEMALQMQHWVNTVVNLRIKKNTLAQVGLIKIRQDQSVTQQMLENLIARGVIELKDVDAMQVQEVPESGESSYKDEETAKKWAQEVTSIFDINLADLPASTSATGAVIQERQARTAFTLIIESMEYMIQRWMDRHVLPHIPKMMKKDKLARVFKDFDTIKDIRERVLSAIAMEELDKLMKSGAPVPSEANLLASIDAAARKLERRGDLFFEMVEDIVVEELDTEVFMSNTEVDVAVTVRNLLELRNGMPPDAMMEMTAEALNLLGLQVPQSLRNPAPIQPTQAQPPEVVTEQLLATEANTINGEQR